MFFLGCILGLAYFLSKITYNIDHCCSTLSNIFFFNMYSIIGENYKVRIKTLKEKCQLSKFVAFNKF